GSAFGDGTTTGAGAVYLDALGLDRGAAVAGAHRLTDRHHAGRKSGDVRATGRMAIKTRRRIASRLKLSGGLYDDNQRQSNGRSEDEQGAGSRARVRHARGLDHTRTGFFDI